METAWKRPELHEGGRKGFIWVSKAWYGPLLTEHAGKAADDINIGVFYKEGGTSGEFSIRWYPVGKHLAMRLEVFEDGMQVALEECKDLMDALSALAGKNPQPEDIFKLLKELGYRDLTPYKQE